MRGSILVATVSILLCLGSPSDAEAQDPVIKNSPSASSRKDVLRDPLPGDDQSTYVLRTLTLGRKGPGDEFESAVQFSEETEVKASGKIDEWVRITGFGMPTSLNTGDPAALFEGTTAFVKRSNLLTR